MTGNGTVQSAVQAMKAGAYEFVTKPFGLNELKLLLEGVAGHLTLKVENRKFAGEGLQNIDEDDDMLSAMARELVERNGIGETADAVWKALNAENQKLFPTATGSNGDIPASDPPGTLIESHVDPACCRVRSRQHFYRCVRTANRFCDRKKKTGEALCSRAGVAVQLELNQAE
jgi:hypothetical protein